MVPRSVQRHRGIGTGFCEGAQPQSFGHDDRRVIRIDEDTFVGTIARLLKKYRIKRVPVTRLGAIVGIVSRSNLLHALSAIAGGALPEPSQDDRDLRARIETALKEVPDITVSLVNFTVEDGHVSV
nr:CBS domain-containing protein [Roseovarius sp. M141]